VVNGETTFRHLPFDKAMFELSKAVFV